VVETSKFELKKEARKKEIDITQNDINLINIELEKHKELRNKMQESL
jgi:hypothetical protein